MGAVLLWTAWARESARERILVCTLRLSPRDGPVQWYDALVWNAQELKTALVEGAERFLGDHGPPISFFDRLHPEERLLETQSPETLTAICMDTVAPLVEYDRRRNSHLRDTLRAYLETDRSLGAAATSLNMHRNTLTKRLERIEALVGLSLTADDDLVSLTLGLRAWELLERTGGR